MGVQQHLNPIHCDFSEDLFKSMALNPNFNQIGEMFTKQYYSMFDNAATRGDLAKLYNAEQSFLSFEGQQMQGTAKIMEKLNSLTFQSIAHIVTSIDCHPMFDGGILVNVMGSLRLTMILLNLSCKTLSLSLWGILSLFNMM